MIITTSDELRDFTATLEPRPGDDFVQVFVAVEVLRELTGGIRETYTTADSRRKQP